MYVETIRDNNKVVDKLISRIKGTDEQKKKMALSYYIAEPAERKTTDTRKALVNKWLTLASQQLSTQQLGAN